MPHQDTPKMATVLRCKTRRENDGTGKGVVLAAIYLQDRLVKGHGRVDYSVIDLHTYGPQIRR